MEQGPGVSERCVINTKKRGLKRIGACGGDFRVKWTGTRAWEEELASSQSISVEGKSRDNLSGESGRSSPKYTIMTLKVRILLVSSEMSTPPFLLLIWNREWTQLSGNVPDHSLDFTPPRHSVSLHVISTIPAYSIPAPASHPATLHDSFNPFSPIFPNYPDSVLKEILPVTRCDPTRLPVSRGKNLLAKYEINLSPT